MSETTQSAPSKTNMSLLVVLLILLAGLIYGVSRMRASVEDALKEPVTQAQPAVEAQAPDKAKDTQAKPPEMIVPETSPGAKAAAAAKAAAEAKAVAGANVANTAALKGEKIPTAPANPAHPQ
jgi:hypothetical protein